ncbi:PQQ dehydrogenase family protein [Dinoroseobacter shibae DFL 12 = DSM 16493]|uniref:PQQ dehydrogenase family protein n=1 Tax=Dinoroseobacter shibae (strain DSM 16493 / NCIMB 14021 / DFL 12) TaxID=398580 RepID=A8LRJ9_DINSH|nr:membrane-bound PQQ-dependent dehydrogenase, glucose/quinate/shikimate family [Dinoroseobacter shibae]ABV94030.1 PQQ dehydrogenase family protein [Dinoroseobacter shibae DFL 12 = DSM 16493]URF45472.1 membrane-bound PQQ-dependent dehydrogenase, glucose/quinate/shikimate family [Dinoroseobacter shibae]URF49777.1 membrane-bound PQQ-dependent dehydrogenase, glucose/quinate/shikimate family [Dinoroseobacter shibae]
MTKLFGAILVLVGALMFVPGIWLIALGGSWYYSLAGAGLAAAGFYYWKKQLLGAWIFGAVFAGTALWAVWEVGFELWPLVPRLVAPMVLAILAVLLVPSLNEGRGRTASLAAAGVLALGIAGFFWGMATPQNVIANTDPVPTRAIAAESPNWTHYGRTPTGTRFAPFDQITPENVGELEVAWTFNHGDAPSGTGQDQNTPLYVDGLVYHCSPNNIVSAIDAVTGAQVWQYDPEASSPLWQRCRGVTYYEPTPREGAPADGTCAARIVLSSVDARLIQLDARTGALCTTFGDGGAVDLTRNMGEVRPGFYFPTSAPTVMGDRIILGGWVWDGMAVDEPSGVVRAFDGRTGEIAWAWDIGNPAIDTVPPEGETYTRGTPNVWSTPAFDAALGLVYLPTGNAQPDFYGSSRIEAANDWNSSIVALDVETGKVVWSFQTTYRDIWDYDVPAQPMLYDITTETGEVVPALIQVTKRSQTFVLDRRDGTPIAEVRDLPVPTTGGVEPDYLSPVQPYSVDMPVIGAEPLTEARMWGATPLDHLYCRIRFRQAYYVGDFTPMSEQGTLIWPGYFGGMNWGTGTIDEARGLLIVNDTRVAHLLQLIPRQEADALGVEVVGPHDGLAPQDGAPFGAMRSNFFSFVGVPCQEPPYGTMTAIDLADRSILWQRPVGTIEETGPFGIRTGWRMPVGLPLVGGPISTASGLTFYSGTQDYYLRAFSSETGEELWRGALPLGSQSTPMSYIGPDGRQYVVVTVGGLNDIMGRGDIVMAFALPEE